MSLRLLRKCTTTRNSAQSEKTHRRQHQPSEFELLRHIPKNNPHGPYICLSLSFVIVIHRRRQFLQRFEIRQRVVVFHH